MEKKYRIRKKIWYTYTGEEIVLSYHVQRLRSFLGIKYWSSIEQDTEFGREPTSFRNLKSAEYFVENILLKNTPIDKIGETVVKEY